jgi:hypothetical protein
MNTAGCRRSANCLKRVTLLLFLTLAAPLASAPAPKRRPPPELTPAELCKGEWVLSYVGEQGRARFRPGGTFSAHYPAGPFAGAWEGKWELKDKRLRLTEWRRGAPDVVAPWGVDAAYLKVGHWGDERFSLLRAGK